MPLLPTRPFLGLITCLAVLIGSPQGVHAQSSSEIADAELAELRGGYFAAGGISFGFGAVVRTYVDGQLALESRLTWTETGPVSARTVGDLPGAVDLSTALGEAVAGGLEISALRNGQGLLLSDANGATALVQNLQGGIQNLIVNNASGRDLRQEVEINLALPDLTAMQRASSMDRLGAAISQEINAGLLAGLGR